MRTCEGEDDRACIAAGEHFAKHEGVVGAVVFFGRSFPKGEQLFGGQARIFVVEVIFWQACAAQDTTGREAECGGHVLHFCCDVEFGAFLHGANLERARAKRSWKFELARFVSVLA